MFQWYKDAQVCYEYLSDVSPWEIITTKPALRSGTASGSPGGGLFRNFLHHKLSVFSTMLGLKLGGGVALMS